MVLYVVVPHKCYYAIQFRDIPPEYILGGACLACAHTGPVNRLRIQRFWGECTDLREVDDYLYCSNCGNRHFNRFIIFGRRLRKDNPPLPAGVLEGAENDGRTGQVSYET